jgi:hypothetical protein
MSYKKIIQDEMNRQADDIKNQNRVRKEITVRLQQEGRHTGEPTNVIDMLIVAVVAKGEVMSGRKGLATNWFSSPLAAVDRNLGYIQAVSKYSNNPPRCYFEGFIADARQMPMVPVRHGWCRLIDGQILDFSNIDRAHRVYYGIVVDKSLIAETYNKDAGFLLDENSIKTHINEFSETFKKIIDEGREQSLNFLKAKLSGAPMP